MIGELLALSAVIGQMDRGWPDQPCGQKVESVAGALPKGADLLNLRDIAGTGDTSAPFSISPDGRKVALVLREADPDRNDYCLTLVVVDIEGASSRAIARLGGGVILARFDVPNLPDYGGGVVQTIVPRWSPDGQSLAYLERRDNVIQVMRVPVAGGAPEQMTHSAVDVRAFRWDDIGSALIFTTRPAEKEADEAIVQEGRQGFRFDRRWMPEWRARPFPARSVDYDFSLDLRSGHVLQLGPARADQYVRESGGMPRSAAGATARIERQLPEFINGPRKIVVRFADGTVRECAEGNCMDARWLVWLDDQTVIFGRPAGWGYSQTQIVRWDVRSGRRKQILTTTDAIDGCLAAATDLVCAIQGAKQPHQLVRIRPVDGKRVPIFDPNPQWQRLTLGEVRRIHWRNGSGVECYGDLVLPPGARHPKSLPLIVVGYEARGFLRGGTGDLFPVFPLAARGFAVLVYNRPMSAERTDLVRSREEADKRGFDDWVDKKSGASSIMAAIAKLEREGIIDPDQIGLTGFSWGVDKATYTLIHNRRFKAVSLAGCCSDPISVNAMIGPYLSSVANAAGYPRLAERNTVRVREYAMAANAAQIDTPILIQAGDREYLGALEFEASYRQLGKRVSLYVFPDEYHVFWQPAHRQAAYLRNIAWFEYFLLKRGRGPEPDIISMDEG